MLGRVFQSFFCSTIFYMHFAIQPRPALTAVPEFLWTTERLNSVKEVLAHLHINRGRHKTWFWHIKGLGVWEESISTHTQCCQWATWMPGGSCSSHMGPHCTATWQKARIFKWDHFIGKPSTKVVIDWLISNYRLQGVFRVGMCRGFNHQASHHTLLSSHQH